MALTLKLRSGDIEPLPELTFDAPRVVVGRAQGSELQLPDPSISLRHASFRERGSEYVLVDEGSENGTFVGSIRLGRHAPHTLRNGDLVRFGRVWVEVGVGPVGARAEPGAARALARELVEQALEQDALPQGVHVSIAGPGAPTTPIRLGQRQVHAIGSDAGAALKLPDPALPERVAELRRRVDQVWVTRRSVEPLAGFEGGAELARGERTLWPPGTTLAVGDYRLTYTDFTLRVLEQLERGATERLSDIAPIDPPRGVTAAEDDEDDDDPEDEDEAEGEYGNAATHDAAKLEPAAAVLAEREAQRPKGRWSPWDSLVLILALGVLASSLWAIRWLAQLGA
jgi:hypothetical protein